MAKAIDYKLFIDKFDDIAIGNGEMFFKEGAVINGLYGKKNV
ncbi:MAG: hypothetical protein ACK5NF_04295 [Bacilli bacterium]